MTAKNDNRWVGSLFRLIIEDKKDLETKINYWLFYGKEEYPYHFTSDTEQPLEVLNALYNTVVIGFDLVGNKSEYVALLVAPADFPIDKLVED